MACEYDDIDIDVILFLKTFIPNHVLVHVPVHEDH